MVICTFVWYIQYSKSHDLYGIIPCKSTYATLHFDKSSRMYYYLLGAWMPECLRHTDPHDDRSITIDSLSLSPSLFLLFVQLNH
ncbi:hypothetical protein ACN38_g12661 [Penicillium nordicum]|uniref:Uncharacterized protein n=1 Tax=Penicillium nordicum TaxID=229535 RepID=A0A0M9W9N7_9EURO|nr:hypothetical protein ACN38_g12661 [Penicillium nordicum]